MTTLIKPEDVVSVPVQAPVAVTMGGHAEARVTVVVTDGYHIQANPASTEFFVPTKLQLRAKGGVRPKAPVYPPGRPYRLEGMPDEFMTYEDTFEIAVPLQASESARPGEHVLKGTLHYQACDDRSCLFPVRIPFSLPVRVVAG